MDNADFEVLTERETAARLRMSHESLRKWRKSGMGPPQLPLPGRSIRYAWPMVRTWLERGAETLETQG